GLFALTLSVFLAAYTVGSLVLHPLMAKKLSPRQEAAWLQILAATAILISIPLARHAPVLLEHWVREPIANGLSHPWAVVAYELYCVLVLVALPASAMGAVFPALARETKAVGTLYFWGNLGSLFGSALFSLVLIPVSGLTSSLLWLAIANAALALRSDFGSKRVRLAGMLVAVICAVLWTRFPPFIKGDFEQKLSSDGYWEEWRGSQPVARLLRY